MPSACWGRLIQQLLERGCGVIMMEKEPTKISEEKIK